jgi:predicted nucleotidyltransferase
VSNKHSVEKILSQLKANVRKIAGENLREVILYGSQARRRASQYSDIDILLIFQKEPSQRVKSTIRNISNQLSLEHDVVIAELIFTQSEYERYRTPFLMNVKREGISV